MIDCIMSTDSDWKSNAKLIWYIENEYHYSIDENIENFKLISFVRHEQEFVFLSRMLRADKEVLLFIQIQILPYHVPIHK